MHRRLLHLAAVVLLLTTAGCASLTSLEAPEVRVTSLQMLESAPGSLEQRFAVGLRLTNPNNRAIDVEGLDFELELNGNRLARGVTDNAFELPRLGEAETLVVVTTSLFDVLRQALDLAGRSEGAMDYRVKGRLHLGSGFVRSIPFDREGRISP